MLTVSGPKSESAYHINQDDFQVNTIIDSLKPGTEYPTLIALCIKLETNPHATFHYTPSVSKALLSRLFNDYDIHSNFLLDLVGRSNYWSAVSQVKPDLVNGQEIYEFHCQQPRWHQHSWYDKQEVAIHRNKAPCSVYMTHSTATNTTVYLVVAPDDGIWFSFIDQIQPSTRQGDNRLITGHELATNPFLIHSMISNIGFEQATLYTAGAQEELMAQLRKVNDYSESLKITRGQNQGAHVFDSREKLSSITRQLHYVSQLLDTGVGRTRSAVKLSSKLLEAHKRFCHQAGQGLPDTAASQTKAVIQYIHDSYVHQGSWLEQFKARKETAMNFVFNIVMQGDSTINLSTSYQMSRDSSSIHTLTVLTMVFLPGTFTATLFSCVVFRTSDSGAAEVTDWLLPFVLVASTLTLTVITLWLAYERIRDWYYAAALKLGQQMGRSRRKLKDMHIV
ncbi:hypothetical protein AU210_012069 [Fusarium oxysporum f. sp. radicis-cucumerinum]|uniref:Uncharacterized protein n=1 Tax=Fusarium oxysporum f. sp. radicis-cucumerinum TaxID=327505 RepID=A0A2H3GVI9_FUSOX|nr:hypothetical protein AU210_012069 [Fusarium oxysporum f. sp. radicis-cucumerinum]